MHHCTCQRAVIRFSPACRALRVEAIRIKSNRVELCESMRIESKTNRVNPIIVCSSVYPCDSAHPSQLLCSHTGSRLPTCDGRKAWDTSSLAQVQGVAKAAGRRLDLSVQLVCVEREHLKGASSVLLRVLTCQAASFGSQPGRPCVLCRARPADGLPVWSASSRARWVFA
jgi:hypothetical protein